MNVEIIKAIDQLSKEKRIDKEVLICAIESAIVSISRGDKYKNSLMEARLDRKSGGISLFLKKEVVEKVEDDNLEITLPEALKLSSEAKIGGEVEIPVVIKDFGRIAAHAAKQVITQKVREAEWENLYQEYKLRERNLLNGIISRVDRQNIYVDLGKVEAILPYNEQIPRENYCRGDRIRAYLYEVLQRKPNNELKLILSRTHPGFVAKLFEMEVPEIAEKIIEIKNTVREPGKRTKIAVFSNDPNVDPVGTCVGMRGSRVQAVVRELDGEKIDIIKWSSDIKTYLTNALSPAQIRKITVKDEETVEVQVNDDQFSLAIGKKGQNARLASKLTGYKIDIKSTASMKQEAAEISKQGCIEKIKELTGVEDDLSTLLVENGYLQAEDLVSATLEELCEIDEIDEAKANEILTATKKFLANSQVKAAETPAVEAAPEKTKELVA